MSHVDHETLKSVGINVGYNSWTCGAGELRRQQSRLGVQIPWTVMIQEKNAGGPALDIGRIDELITQGKALGIYTYLFHCREAGFIGQTERLASSHPDCGFVFFLPSGAVSEATARMMQFFRNAVFVIPADAFCMQSAKLLREHRCFFGVYAVYQDDTIHNILLSRGNGCFLNAFCTFAFLLAAPECGENSKKEAWSFVDHHRTQQRDPVFWVDSSDLSAVGKMIGGGANILSLDTAGGWNVFGEEEKAGTYDVTGESLEDIMKRAMPPAKTDAAGEEAARVPPAENFSSRYHPLKRKENL